MSRERNGGKTRNSKCIWKEKKKIDNDQIGAQAEKQNRKLNYSIKIKNL